MRLVLGQGVMLTVVGVAVGLLGAYWLMHLLAGAAVRRCASDDVRRSPAWLSCCSAWRRWRATFRRGAPRLSIRSSRCAPTDGIYARRASNDPRHAEGSALRVLERRFGSISSSSISRNASPRAIPSTRA